MLYFEYLQSRPSIFGISASVLSGPNGEEHAKAGMMTAIEVADKQPDSPESVKP